MQAIQGTDGWLATERPRRIGVIDIGSNSIRLVVFDGLRRTPIPVYNEKVLCGLGRGLSQTGRLNPKGVRRAHANLIRFVALAVGVGVAELDVVATAAVREAEDGPDFVAEVQRRCKVKVDVLSGEEEAQLAALGVISGIPEADGIVGDLGGGSLELVAVAPAGLGPSVTLPLGPLRLMHEAGKAVAETDALVNKALEGLDWLEQGQGRAFYPVGGAWRAMARIHMAHTQYPLHVIDHYAVPYREMDSLLSVVMKQTPRSLASIPDISRGRLETLPVAARVMRRLLAKIQPSDVVFSAQGLREGMLYRRLSEEVRREDPLLSACRDLATGLRRFDVIGEEVMAWTSPLFPSETPAERRLRESACLIADVGWIEHPDYRSEHAFHKALRLPAVGIDHAGRAFLALVLAARYGGAVRNKALKTTGRLLGNDAAERAEVLGLALRLAIDLSGGASGVLSQTRLELDDKRVSLVLSSGAQIYAGDVVGRRLEPLAAALEHKAAVVQE